MNGKVVRYNSSNQYLGTEKQRRKDRKQTPEILILKKGPVCGVYPQRHGAMRDSKNHFTPTHMLALLQITHQIVGCKRKIPRSVISSKYGKCGVSPTVPARPQTHTVLVCSKRDEQIKNWICICLKYTTDLKQHRNMMFHFRSIYKGVRRGVASLPLNLYYLRHVSSESRDTFLHYFQTLNMEESHTKRVRSPLTESTQSQSYQKQI